MKIGDKVVCVSSIPVHHPFTGYTVFGETANVVGRVYVIASFHIHECGELGLGFVGSRCFSCGVEVGWNASRFRLLDQMRAEVRERSRKGNSVPLLNENQMADQVNQNEFP